MDLRIRTITAGINLSDLSNLESVDSAVTFLKEAEGTYAKRGYEVQTLRIATQNLHELTVDPFNEYTITQLKAIDTLITNANVMLSIGELIEGNQGSTELTAWAVRLIKETSNISFSIPISSVDEGTHYKSIKVAASICKELSQNSKGGEANFRFTASANCPAGIPFFPAAYHKGPNSFAIGIEYPNLITKVFQESTWENAEENLKKALSQAFQPIEETTIQLASEEWKYDGIDTSPAPGLDASIATAIETLTNKPFGSTSTLSACALITRAIKNLDIKSCGYSGLMLPVIEDKVLAQRAGENRFTVEELILYSAVSGTGLDVIPLAGDISEETITGVYQDLAALSLRYFNKPLSARLFPIPGKTAGDTVQFDNPYLTTCTIMKLA